MMVYVDDFKMAGPAHTLKEAWDKIRKDIQLGAEGDVSKYLGCNHVITNEIKHGKKV